MKLRTRPVVEVDAQVWAALNASHERLLEALTYLYRHAEERLSEHELEVADAAIAEAQKVGRG